MSQDLADYLKRMLAAHPGLSYRRAAQEAGLSNSLITQIINRTIKQPSPETLAALAAQWGTPEDYQVLMKLAGYAVPEQINLAGLSNVKQRVVALLAHEAINDSLAAAIAQLLTEIIEASPRKNE